MGVSSQKLLESAASAAACDSIAADYRILHGALRGQGGRSFLVNDVADKVCDGQVVLAVVDLDKVVGDIAQSARERLKRFLPGGRQHGVHLLDRGR